MIIASHYQARLAKAWEQRVNDPTLVQDKSKPKFRKDLEARDAVTKTLTSSGVGISVDLMTSMRAALARAGWDRKKGTKGRGVLVGISDKKVHPLDHRSRHPGGSEPGGSADIPYFSQYQNYTTARQQLQEQGVLDSRGEGRFRTSEEEFRFNELENELKQHQELMKLSGADNAGGMTLMKSSPKDVSSTAPHSTALKAETSLTGEGALGGILGRRQTLVGGAQAGLLGRRQTLIGATLNDKQPALGLQKDEGSRLTERRQTLLEGQDSTGEAGSRHKHRKRVKTADRRQLNKLLIGASIESKNQKGHGRSRLRPGDISVSLARVDARAVRLNRPAHTGKADVKFTSGGWSKDGDGTTGKTLLVGPVPERSPPATNGQLPATGGQLPATGGQLRATDGQPYETDDASIMMEGHEELTDEPSTQLHQPQVLGPIRHGMFSRLYQPTRAQRSKFSQSQGTLEGMKRDKAFLQRIQNGRQNGQPHWSWQDGRHGDGRHGDGRHGDGRNMASQEGEGQDTGQAAPTEPGGRALAWSYNMPGQKTSDSTTQASQFWDPVFKSQLDQIDDLKLRKLLEELYRDKKYMDKMIGSLDGAEQDDILGSFVQGREYLLQRAQFWLERGPLPPRPPATDLGLRLLNQSSLSSKVASMESVRPVESVRLENSNTSQPISILVDANDSDKKDPSQSKPGHKLNHPSDHRYDNHADNHQDNQLHNPIDETAKSSGLANHQEEEKKRGDHSHESDEIKSDHSHESHEIKGDHSHESHEIKGDQHDTRPNGQALATLL